MLARALCDRQSTNVHMILDRIGTLALGKGIQVQQVILPVSNLHPSLDGFRIVQLSDFHLYPYTRMDQVRDAVAIANDLRPDLTVLTGDYVSHIPEAVFDLGPVLSGLNADHGVFTVLGNHDVWTSRTIVEQGLREVGLAPLNNEGIVLKCGRGQLGLAGLDDGWVGQPDLSSALDSISEGIPIVLLAHEPDLADIYTQNPRISVQLSGHTHGGQVRLPKRGAFMLPHLGQKYDYGLYRVNQSWLYTNAGIGFGSIPIRINCPPEVTEVILTIA